MTISPVRAGTLAALATLLLTGSAAAQRSTTRGFTLGAHLQAASLTIEDGDPDNGGGLGIRAGYGFNRLFTGYLEIDGIAFDVENPELNGNWSMAHVDLGMRFNFANSLRRWVPFLEAALGGRAVTVDDASVDNDAIGSVSFNGGAFSIGGGVGFFVSQKVALETVLKWSAGEFTEIDVGNLSVSGLDIEATSFRFKFGVAWWP
jgi:hypothetical protein